MMTYKGFFGTSESSTFDGLWVWHGKVWLEKDFVGYHGETYEEFEAAFRAAVDDYLQTCKSVKKQPESSPKADIEHVSDYSKHMIAESVLKSLEQKGHLQWQHCNSPLKKLAMVNDMIEAIEVAFSDELRHNARQAMMEMFIAEVNQDLVNSLAQPVCKNDKPDGMPKKRGRKQKS